MDADDKGDLVMTIGVNEVRAHQQKNILRAYLVLVVALPIGFFFAFSYLVGADATYSLMGALLVFAMIFWGYLNFEWLLSRMIHPVKIYQKGLEFKLCHLDRIRRRSAFLPKDALESAYLAYSSPQPDGKADPKKANRITFTSKGKKKRAYSVSARPAADILQAAEYVEREWNLVVHNKPRPYKIKTT